MSNTQGPRAGGEAIRNSCITNNFEKSLTKQIVVC